MRYAVLVTQVIDREPATLYGSFRTPEAAALVAARAQAIPNINARVLPINPGRAFTDAHPGQPIPGHD